MRTTILAPDCGIDHGEDERDDEDWDEDERDEEGSGQNCDDAGGHS